MRYNLKEIIKPYLRRHKRFTAGIKISAYGKFTRRQRSHKHKFGYGKVPFSTFNMAIDFKRASCRLRYGVCGIRVWVSKFIPTWYTIKEFIKDHYYLFQIKQYKKRRKEKREQRKQKIRHLRKIGYFRLRWKIKIARLIRKRKQIMLKQQIEIDARSDYAYLVKKFHDHIYR